MTMKDIMSNLPTREDLAEVIVKMKDLTGSLPSKEDLLESAGLRMRKTTGDDFLLGLTMFGAGILVGAAVALLFAPKSGTELREDLRERASDLREQYTGQSESSSRSSMYAPTT